MNLVKQMQILEDGGIKLTLSNAQEVDLYMLEMMKQTPLALPCIQKKRAKSVFLYETLEWMRLKRMLELYVFDESEALHFLIALFQSLSEIEKEYPIYATLDSVYYDMEQAMFHCVVLPIHRRFYENDWRVFIKELLDLLRVQEGDALFGRLFQITKCTIEHANTIQEALCHFQRHRRLRERIKRKLHVDHTWKQQRKVQIQNEIAAQKLARRNRKEDTTILQKASSDTVVLFPDTSHAYLLKDDNQIPLDEKNVLGRHKKCTIRFEEATISAYHAQIIQNHEGFVLVDLSSSNGTWLNDVKIAPQSEQLLHDNDIIQLAEVTLIYKEEL